MCSADTEPGTRGAAAQSRKGAGLVQEKQVKVGIVTHYYRSTNYGGNLQAYALCRFINDTFPSARAEQIAYDISGNARNPRRLKRLTPKRLLKKLYTAARNRLYAKTRRAEREAIQTREKAVSVFNREAIPHSETTYTADTVAQSAAQYDVFITGSDQVWHPSAVCPAYLLQFVSGEKKRKASYAASVAKTELTEAEKAAMQAALADFYAVSVREEDAVGLLAPLAPVQPVWTLDPTLLLTQAQWLSVAAARRVQGDYVFCYFLGDDTRQREIAGQFAKAKGQKLVTLPFLQGKYRKCDDGFGDEPLFDVSVPDFLALIRDASYVLTDSFHAAVFSVLFEREFFVFERAHAKGAGSRVESLLSLFDMESRFCNSPQKAQLSYLLAQPPVGGKAAHEKFEARRRVSVRFLEDVLDTAQTTGRD